MKLNKEMTTPISVSLRKIHSVSGEICLAYTKQTLFKVARITYELFEDESYQYIFEPYYDVIDGLEDVDWGGIPGLDLESRQKQYYRVGIVPVFISERTPSPNRINLLEELKQANLAYLDRLQWLINTNTVYTGDKLLVKPDGFNSFKGISNQSAQWHTLSILHLLGMRIPIEIEGRVFSGDERTSLIRAFVLEYEFLSAKRRKSQAIGQVEARERGVYQGRKPIKVSIPMLDEVQRNLSSGLITFEEAMQLTKMSRATLYRNLKRLREL